MSNDSSQIAASCGNQSSLRSHITAMKVTHDPEPNISNMLYDQSSQVSENDDYHANDGDSE